MRVVVDALGVRNLSGRNVLLGHLFQLAAMTTGRHEYVVLYHRLNRAIHRDLGSNVEWLQCSSCTANWAWRHLWRRTGRLPVGNCPSAPQGVLLCARAEPVVPRRRSEARSRRRR